MLAWLTVSFLILSVVALARIPRHLLHSYRASFGARHGVSVQLSLTLLATITVTMIFATLMLPGASLLMELVNAAVVLLCLAAFCFDLYLFTRSRVGSK